MDQIIASEERVGQELTDLLYRFKQEKERSGFSFGTLCVLHYDLYADHFDEEIYRVAAALEFVILAFDIMDDLQDGDSDYVWAETPAYSLNAIVAMLFMATHVLRQSHFIHRDKAIVLLEEYTFRSIRGQQLDLSNTCRDEQSYVRMIQLKSGSLVAMSCLIGTVLAHGEVVEEIKTYATALGVIQQIKNDILDLKQWHQKNDILNKRYSLPIIFLFALENDISEKLVNYYNSDSFELDGATVQATLQKSGAIRYALAMKNVYCAQAMASVELINMSPSTKNYLFQIMK